MAIETTLNFYPYFPGNIDGRLGPYSSSAHATGSIESIYRYTGMTVFVSSSTEAAEYWFRDGTSNSDLILKTSPSSGSFSGIYSSSFSGSGAVTIDDVGGIDASTSVDNLEGKTFSELFDEIFFPTIQPEGTDGTFSSVTDAGSTREIGEEINVTITSNFTRGTWIVPAQSNRNYLGEADIYYYTSGSTTDTSPLTNYTWPSHKVTPATNNFPTAVSYSIGDIPVNSKGVELPELQRPEGFKTDPSVSFTGIYPWFYGSSSAATLTVEEVVAAIEAIYVPTSTNTVRKVEVSTGTIIANYPNVTSMWCWFATPQTSTAKMYWYETALNNGPIGGTDATNTFKSPTLNTPVNTYINGVEYKIYMPGFKTTFTNNNGDVQLKNTP
jgi:hypothetical protein